MPEVNSNQNINNYQEAYHAINETMEEVAKKHVEKFNKDSSESAFKKIIRVAAFFTTLASAGLTAGAVVLTATVLIATGGLATPVIIAASVAGGLGVIVFFGGCITILILNKKKQPLENINFDVVKQQILDMAEKEKSLKEFTDKFNEKAKAYAEAEKKINDLNTELNQQKFLSKNSGDKNSEIINEKSNLIKQLEEDIKIKGAEIEKLGEELKLEKENLVNKQDELNIETEKFKKLEDDYKKLKFDLENNDTIGKQKLEITDLKNRNVKLGEQINTLIKKSNEAKVIDPDQVTNLNKQIENHKTTIQKLTNDLMNKDNDYQKQLKLANDNDKLNKENETKVKELKDQIKNFEDKIKIKETTKKIIAEAVKKEVQSTKDNWQILLNVIDYDELVKVNKKIFKLSQEGHNVSSLMDDISQKLDTYKTVKSTKN